ncbi:MAG: SprT family zinc-dependent metalloprotease [Pseudorhodobacter sp.]|nr:SprT family zinc-dependent metalloprotease [Pseudorhodobacter sp.]
MPILPGPPGVEITLRRSARARRFSLRVSQLDGRVTLSLPLRAREAEAIAFVRGHEGWIRAALAGVAQVAPVAIGAVLLLEGRLVTLEPGSGRVPQLVDDSLRVPGAAAQVAVRVERYLRALARDRLIAASDRHADTLGCRYRSLTLRDTRSRWGSCTAAGGLMYSWRLIMAPPEVLDYVAAHEVAHLVEMNHSAAFWAVLARLCPGYQGPRRWLKGEGRMLHGYRFAP